MAPLRTPTGARPRSTTSATRSSPCARATRWRRSCATSARCTSSRCSPTAGTPPACSTGACPTPRSRSSCPARRPPSPGSRTGCATARAAPGSSSTAGRSGDEPPLPPGATVQGPPARPGARPHARGRVRAREQRPCALRAVLAVGRRGAVHPGRGHAGVGGRRRPRGGRRRPRPGARGRRGAGRARAARVRPLLAAGGRAGRRRRDGRGARRRPGGDVAPAHHGRLLLPPRDAGRDRRSARVGRAGAASGRRRGGVRPRPERRDPAPERSAADRDRARVGGGARGPSRPGRRAAPRRRGAGDRRAQRHRRPQPPLPDAERAGRLAGRDRRSPARPRLADGAAAGAAGLALRPRRRRATPGDGAARAPARGRRPVAARAPDPPPDPVSAIDVTRPELRALVGYRWQDTLPADAPLMRFDMNTSAVAPAWYARELARLARVTPNSYPDATFLRLRGAIAAYTGFPVEQIAPTAGADEALLLCGLLSLAPGRRAYVRRPAYGYYGVVTQLTGAELVHDPEAEVDLTWICAPHNPTGADAAEEDLGERPGLVVIDQAYLEFGGTDLSGLVRERENTVVVRTLSKAFALAGIRVGYIVAPAAIAERLNGVRPPASIGVHSAALAEIALEAAHVEEMRDRAAATCAERERMAAALRAAGHAVAASCTNFALVDVGRPAEPFARELLERGLVVRTFADPLLETSIRYSVATPAEDDYLLEALGAAAPAPRGGPPSDRAGTVERRTNETEIRCRVALDGAGRATVATGIGMLDHMLGAVAAHSLLDLELACAGDLW